MNGGRYILDGHTPVPCDSLMEWANRFEKDNRHVGDDTAGGVRVSTVFLGIDHSFGSSGPPLLFETMVFGGEHDGKQERYSTWEEAEEGHARFLQMVKP